MCEDARNMYIYHLPHPERRQLCIILDQNNTWEELAGSFMKYDFTTISMLRQEIQRGKSPSDELLTLWGHQNHTVLELFILLYRMKHFQAMMIIKPFVPAKCHKLINEGEHNIEQLFADLKLKKRQCRESNVLAGNLNNVDEKLLAEVKDVGHFLPGRQGQPVEKKVEVSWDDNESMAKDKHLLKPKSPNPARRGSTKESAEQMLSCVVESAGTIPQIPYEELQRSTNDWSNSNILGKGGFGTVFKGTWKCTQVAIKRIEQKQNNAESHNQQLKQSITELHCLNAYRHDNILPLYGFCAMNSQVQDVTTVRFLAIETSRSRYSIGGPQPCLVYQYMSGGCLERRLRIRDQTKVLQWRTRLDVAIGTARGLQYLHTIGDKPLIHGDIKPANILLDPNFVPKIGDFGLAREGPQSGCTHKTVSRIHGTMPYLPDEFLRGGKLSTKVDTYSFGIVLFELATALSAFTDKRKDKFLKDHVVSYAGDALELKDARAAGGEGYFGSLLHIGKMCVTKKAKDRPEMVDVLIKLENVIV